MRNTRQLWVQGLLAIGLAIVVGVLAPDTAVAFMPLADAFIALLPLMLAPIIVTTVVLGLAHVGDLGHIGHIGLIGHIGHIGHIGLKALLYFKNVSTLGLLTGFVAVSNVIGNVVAKIVIAERVIAERENALDPAREQAPA